MAKPVSAPEHLERLILIIDARLASIEEAFGSSSGLTGAKAYEHWAARNQAYRAIVDDLVSIELAKFSQSIQTYVLTLAGIRTSCTGGEHGLLTNWLRRAREEIALARKAVA